MHRCCKHVSDLDVQLMCVDGLSLSQSNTITPSAACLICWPFILSGLFTASLHVLLPKLQPFRTLPHTLPLHLACSLQLCPNASRVVSMATKPCPYKALRRLTTHLFPFPFSFYGFLTPFLHPHTICVKCIKK